MTSTFVAHHTRGLALYITKPRESTVSARSSAAGPPAGSKEALHSLLVNLKPPLSSEKIKEAITSLIALEDDRGDASLLDADPEEESLKAAVTAKLIVGVYAQAMDMYLQEATEAEGEADWWADVERSRYNILRYSIQS